MLHRGHTYRYTGDPNDQEALIDFAVDTFHDSEHKAKVPIMPTLLEELRDLFNSSVEHKGGLINAMLMKDSDGRISYGALFCVYILPVLTVWGFYKLMQIPFSPEDDVVERTRIIEEHNRIEKQKIDNWI